MLVRIVKWRDIASRIDAKMQEEGQFVEASDSTTPIYVPKVF
jgi:hypothetical protein